MSSKHKYLRVDFVDVATFDSAIRMNGVELFGVGVDDMLSISSDVCLCEIRVQIIQVGCGDFCQKNQSQAKNGNYGDHSPCTPQRSGSSRWKSPSRFELKFNFTVNRMMDNNDFGKMYQPP